MHLLKIIADSNLKTLPLDSIYKQGERGRGASTPDCISQSFAMYLIEENILQGGFFHQKFDGEKQYDPQERPGWVEKLMTDKLLHGGMIDQISHNR